MNSAMQTIVDEIERQRKDAKRYLLAGDYDRAIDIATATLGDLALIPDGEKAGDAGAKLSWDRNAILEFIKVVEHRRNDASINSSERQGGIAVTPVTYTRACS